MFKKKGGKKYFGVPLDPNSGEVPKLVIEAIDYLEDHLNESGLFRISGQMNIITEIKNKWDKGVHESFSKQPIPHNVTGVLKLYLKEMPEPLLTFSRYDAFLHLGGEKDLSKRLSETKKLLETLPKTNYATIKVLLRLLNKIAACSATNNMRAANLSMVFAPNVFRPEVETIEYIVTDTPLTNAEFEFMIENYPSLFNDQSGKLLSSSQQPQQAQQQPPANLSESSSSTNKGNDAHSGQSDPLQMMSGDFNIEELANLGGDMLQPSLRSDLGLAPQPPSSDVTEGNNEPQQQQADEMNHNDPVWNFRAQSYVVIENIYDITNIISENIPGIRCISELVYITTLLLETFEGTQCPIEEKLAESKTAPLQHVKDADETRLLPLLNICGDLLTQVADEIGSYVESLAEKMSFIEEMEPLKPIDERFRWIENTLVRANDAFEEPGAYVPDDPNAVSDVVVDASVIREIPGIPDDIDNTINLEGYVEESGEAAVDIPPPSQPEQQQQQKVDVQVKAPEVKQDIPPPQAQKVEVQAKAPEVKMDIPPPQAQKVDVHVKAPEVQMDIPPPQPKVSAPVAPTAQPQAVPQEQNKITVKTQIKIQSNVAVNKQQVNTPAIATAAAAIAASKAAPVNKQAPAAQNPTPVTVKTAATVGEKTQPTAAAATSTAATAVTAKTQQKSVADAVAGMVNAKAAQGGAVAPSTQKVAQAQVKKSEKPKTEGQRLDGSMLADPTGKIIEVLQLIQNDLRTIDPQEARSICTLISNIKIMIEHPNDDPGKIALITASTNVPTGVGIIGYTNTILIDTIHLLQELKERCVAKMHSADAITTANLLKAITKAIIERDKAELESLEG